MFPELIIDFRYDPAQARVTSVYKTDTFKDRKWPEAQLLATFCLFQTMLRSAAPRN